MARISLYDPPLNSSERTTSDGMVDAAEAAASRSALLRNTDSVADETTALSPAAEPTSTDDAVIVTDSGGAVQFLSPGAERLTGWCMADARDHVLDRVVRILEPRSRRVLALAALEATRTEGVLIDRADAERAVSITATPVRNGRGETLSVVWLLRAEREPTTERSASPPRRDDTASLRQEIATLRDAAERKDQFLATLAHQLRNPLAPIRNAISFMQVGGNDASAWTRGTTIIDRQLSHLTRLVDDLLDLSRIARGLVELRREPILLATILEGAVETSRPVIEAAGHSLAVSGTPNVWLDADGTRLAQALANVLNNAARYTPPGGKIRVMAERQEATATIRIEDTGIGLRAEQLQSIFDAFSGGDRSSGTAGLGIGLTLARRLIELHGGDIAAASKGPGLGSTIVVRLPCLPDQARQAASPRSPAPSYGELSQAVLVVDDNRDSTDSLVVLLEMLGHRCVGVYDAASALDRAVRLRPTLVFLDITLPDKTGYEVAAQLRRELGTSAILVAMTGWSQPSDVAKALEAGFDHHLAKPIRLEDVRQLLRRSVT